MDPAAVVERYGGYPIAHVFSRNEGVVPAPTMTNLTGPSDELNGSVKRHAACDECRKRKLKCSGEMTGCSRCVKTSLLCNYSEQKQMGRPKKRQKTDEVTSNAANSGASHSQESSHAVTNPTLSPAEIERTNFQNICNAPLAQTVRKSVPPVSQRSGSMNNTPSSDHPRTPPDADILNSGYPTDYSLWPDFSDTDIPLPVIDGYGTKAIDDNFQPLMDPDVDPSYLQSLPSIPDCPCLPNLYLTLSTLSTLSSFPVSTHTVSTLASAHRTARNVLYCSVCPQKFQSGSQNVMLSSTLLTVLVDSWQRVLKCPPFDLRKGFADPTDDTPIGQIEDLEWRTFTFELVRHHVFGDRPYPSPPPSTTSIVRNVETVTLMSLAKAMERRQKQWHSLEPPTGEFPERLTNHLAAGYAAGLTLEDIRRYEHEHDKDNTHLCLQLCKHTQMCIRSLDKPVPTLGV